MTNIPDEAIAAAAAAMEPYFGATDEYAARLAVEAAAPLIAAQVLPDDALARARNEGFKNGVQWINDEIVKSLRALPVGALVLLGDVVARALAPENGRERSPAVGRCGAPPPSIIDPPPVTHCSLPAGHDGWHRDDQGMEWAERSPVEPPPFEIYDCGARPECADGCAGRAQRFQCIKLNTGLVTTVRLKADAPGRSLTEDAP